MITIKRKKKNNVCVFINLIFVCTLSKMLKNENSKKPPMPDFTSPNWNK